MYLPYLAIFRQLFTYGNCCTALDCNSLYSMPLHIIHTKMCWFENKSSVFIMHYFPLQLPCLCPASENRHMKGAQARMRMSLVALSTRDIHPTNENKHTKGLGGKLNIHLDLVPILRMVKLYLHSPICLHDILLHCMRCYQKLPRLLL
jgi:hypothetical protein